MERLTYKIDAHPTKKETGKDKRRRTSGAQHLLRSTGIHRGELRNTNNRVVVRCSSDTAYVATSNPEHTCFPNKPNNYLLDGYKGLYGTPVEKIAKLQYPQERHRLEQIGKELPPEMYFSTLKQIKAYMFRYFMTEIEPALYYIDISNEKAVDDAFKTTKQPIQDAYKAVIDESDQLYDATRNERYKIESASTRARTKNPTTENSTIPEVYYEMTPRDIQRITSMHVLLYSASRGKKFANLMLDIAMRWSDTKAMLTRIKNIFTP